MDPEWTEVACVQLSSSNGSGPEEVTPTGVTALAFDTTQELMWTGNSEGRVASFYGSDVQSYVSYVMQPASDGEVRQILLNDTGVISLGPRGLHMALRRGLPLWNCRHEAMQDMCCMSFTSSSNTEVLVAGRQSVMFVVDLKEGEVVQQIEAKAKYTLMKRNSRVICAATDHGTVDIIDPSTFQVIKSWTAHSAFIHDMDVQADYLVTCGATLKQQGSVMFDPYVNLFDLKQMTSMAPIPFPPCAAFVRMHPRMVTTAFVASTSGQIHIIDLMSPNTSNVKQANITSFLARIEISMTGNALVLADSDCFMHLWGAPNRMQFTAYPTMIETDAMATRDTLKWDWDDISDDERDEEDIKPFSAVGVPYYREQLLSAWPSNMVSDVGAPPPRYDPSMFDAVHGTTTKFDYGWYTANTTGTLPNQVEETRKGENKTTQAIQAPKFLSERSRDGGMGSSAQQALPNAVDEFDASLASSEKASLGNDAPKWYRSVEIKFSKFGVDDFDFAYYNRSRYAGLENHIANSYANALLQLLRFTPTIRNLALQHAAGACLDGQCLLCELGYLCDMLQKAEGATCQATNMLKTLSSLPQAHQLRLIEEENPNTPITEMLQNLTRFLLTQIAGDFSRMLPDSTAMEDALATSGVTYMRCMACKSETKRPVSTYVNNLKYPAPQRPTSRGPKYPRVTFSQVLKSSVEQDSSTKGWCEVCNRYQTLQNRKTITSIPSVLTLNASGPQNLNYPELKRLWGTPGWLPDEIGIIVDTAGQFFCYEGEDLKLHLQRGIHDIKVYSLIGMAASVDNGGQPAKSHLVAMVNVGYSEPTPPEQPQWHLFNDFLVHKTTANEALTFNTNWKTPSVVLFQLKSDNNKIDMEWKSRIDTSVLYIDNDMTPEQLAAATYKPLSPGSEKPGKDTIVALDTEFVALKQPEIEMNSEGEMETIRPMTHALARVSVLRGQGMDEGVPFIDDYIIIKETVVDYLTLYSGITANDLDPRKSTHTLVPLKRAFKKLWVLLNLGCRFLGHGLKQDFRVINIQVPKAQIIDTIDLFFLKTRLRKLSLAFLAWSVLKENIQLETHDSIEDARTALKLYRKYLEFEDAGILETQLQEIYREGRDTNFKPPKRGGDDAEMLRGTDTPPVGAPAPGSAISPLLARSQPAPPSIAVAATAAAAIAAENAINAANASKESGARATPASMSAASTPTPAPPAAAPTAPQSAPTTHNPTHNNHTHNQNHNQNHNHTPANTHSGSTHHNTGGGRHNSRSNAHGPMGGRGHGHGHHGHGGPNGGGSGRYHAPNSYRNQNQNQNQNHSGHDGSGGGHSGHSGHNGGSYRQYRRN